MAAEKRRLHDPEPNLLLFGSVCCCCPDYGDRSHVTSKRAVALQKQSGHAGSTHGNVKRLRWSAKMTNMFRQLWSQDEAQDIAEYAVMLAVILVIVVGTLRLIGGSANNVFS